MELLEKILSEHYLPEKKDEILSLLIKVNVLPVLQKLTSRVNTQLISPAKKTESAPITEIASISSSFLVAVNGEMVKMENLAEKREVEKILSEIAFRILLSIVKSFPAEGLIILQTVKKSIRSACEMLGFKYEEIEHLMAFKQAEIVFLTISGNTQANTLSSIKKKSNPYLLWTKKVPLDFLLHELSKRKWIKRKSNFAKLLDTTNNDTKIYWDFKYRAHLAYLFFRLKELDYIRPVGTKGYFSILERYIVDFSGKSLSKGSLRKLSSKVKQDSEYYALLISDIDAIIETISASRKRGY